MQKPLFRGVRPQIEDLGQYNLRPDVKMALALTFKICQQHNGIVLEAPQIDMATSLHWLLCITYRGRGLKITYIQLCDDYKRWHLRKYKKQRHKTFYQGRIKGLLAVAKLFNILEGEVMSAGGGRTLAHFNLKLLNPDRIWDLYLPERQQTRVLSGLEVRSAWDELPAAHQLLLAGSKRSLAWAKKHMSKSTEDATSMSEITKADAALLQLFYQYPKTIDLAMRRGFQFSNNKIQQFLESLFQEWVEYSRVTGYEFFKACSDKDLIRRIENIIRIPLRVADPEAQAFALMGYDPPAIITASAPPPAPTPAPISEFEEIRNLLLRLCKHLGA